jgi:hypothetical protein
MAGASHLTNELVMRVAGEDVPWNLQMLDCTEEGEKYDPEMNIVIPP